MNKLEGKENIFSSLNLQEVTSARGGKTSNYENSSNKNGQRSQKHHEGQGQLKPSFTSVCIFPACVSAYYVYACFVLSKRSAIRVLHFGEMVSVDLFLLFPLFWSEGIKSPDTGVTGGCKLLCLLKTEPRSSRRVVSALNP